MVLFTPDQLKRCPSYVTGFLSRILSYKLFCFRFTAEGLDNKYNFSRCDCKIVLCWYVDSLVCRLRNYVKN